MATDVKSAAEVLEMGLDFIGITPEAQQTMAHEQLLADFRDHYGCLPVDIAQMWYDLQTTGTSAKLNEKEKTNKGFKLFMVAHYYLWCHPKNAGLIKSRFGICKRYIQSNDHLWKWITKMSEVFNDKIVWDEAQLSSDDFYAFIASIDGVDFDIWEKPSARYNIDSDLCSYKSRHGSFRYLIAMSIFESKCIYVHGPVKAGNVGDLAQWRLDMKAKMLQLPAGKLVVADRGYQTSEPDEVGLFAIPNNRDPPELKTFKTRVRCRHETFNGRLKHHKILQDVFRFDSEKHHHVVRAICLRVQYAMDSGSPLFEP